MSDQHSAKTLARVGGRVDMEPVRSLGILQTGTIRAKVLRLELTCHAAEGRSFGLQ